MIYMMYLIPLMVWIVIAKIIWHTEFSVKEMAIQTVPTMLVIAGMFALSTANQTSDTMLVNGVVESKNIRKESCPSGWVSYQDSFCSEYTTRQVFSHQTCSTVNKIRTCTNHYDTEYNYDYSWEQRFYVHSTLGKYQVPRVDRQGANTPDRYTEVQKNDPVTASKSFVNYIKVESLLNQKYDDVPPIAYPRVRDLYKVNRVIYYQAPPNSQFIKEWNDSLAKVNANLKDTNVIFFVTTADKSMAEKLAQAWDAHNINDVVVSLGIDGDTVKWVDVRSWSANDLVNVTIRDEILNLPKLDYNAINNVVAKSIGDYYKPRDMSEFEYLAEQIRPALWVQILAALILIIITPAITWWFTRPENNF